MSMQPMTEQPDVQRPRVADTVLPDNRYLCRVNSKR